MKKIFLLLAPFAFAAVVSTSLSAATASVPAGNIPAVFQRSGQSLISFELTAGGAGDSRIEIRDENGRTVTTRTFSTTAFNVPTANFQPGKYSYSVASGRKTSQGVFFVK
ncbi:hypothetical protein ACTHGU_12155 [Chitinophagaceae bacterium MMS25-I14]